MMFDVEIVLRERDYAVTERVEMPGGDGRSARDWTEDDVECVLKEILQALDRVRNPGAASRPVTLRGFSWIVEPFREGGVVIAIEIQAGAAVAGPFATDHARLDALIRRVLAAASPSRETLH